MLAPSADRCAADDRPNIVLIYADDLGYADLGCYGNEYHETPNIDRLMREGVRFTQAYANAPLCAPSRVGLLTGRHCARAGCYEVAPGRYLKRVNLDLVDFLPPENKLRLPDDRKILPEYLQEIGYLTGFFGKWHVGPEKPSECGFDDHVTLWNGSHLDVTKSFQGKSDGYPDPNGYSSEYLSRCADQFLAGVGDAPFFLYLPHTLVHTAMGPGTMPLEPKPDLLKKYQSKAKTEWHSNPAYAAMVESLDDSVAATLESLRRHGLLRNTVVVFTSDNGGLLGGTRVTESGLEVGRYTTNYPLRSGKSYLYEGGIRVPMSITFADGSTPARTSDAIVSQLDLVPTILDLVQHPAAEETASGWDGVSLLEELNSGDGDLTDRALFWHYPGYRMQNPKATRREEMVGQRPASAMRQGRWKLIESLETGAAQLYDLDVDIGETENVAADHSEVSKQMIERLQSWRLETNAPMPTEKSNAVSVPAQESTIIEATSQWIANPGFEDGEKAPASWIPTQWRSRWAMVPGEGGRGRCLRLEGSGKSPVWRSSVFPLDTNRDHTLSARLRTIRMKGNRAEFYLEALDASGKVFGTLGKGWPAYRTAAGVSATATQAWQTLNATIRREDIPKGATHARAVCAVQVHDASEGFAFFDDLACQRETLTSRFQLFQESQRQAGNLGTPSKPLVFRFDLDAPEMADQSFCATMSIGGYYGVSLREREVAFEFDQAGRAQADVDVKAFQRMGWYSVRLYDASGQAICKSAFGMVDPTLADSAVDPLSPYGVAEVGDDSLEIARRVGIKSVRHGVTFRVQWGWIEPHPGHFNDHILKEAIKKTERLESFGIQTGVMIGGWSDKNIPPWAQNKTSSVYKDTQQRQDRPKGNYSLPAKLDAWQKYLSHIAAVFRGRLLGWEIWNENDIPAFWQGSVEDYLKLLEGSAAAVRAADPDAKIAMCGISTTIVGQDHQEWLKQHKEEVRRQLDIDFDPRGFMHRVIRDGKQDFDILNFHPYGTIDEIEKGCRLFRSAAASSGCEDRPLWITETGVGTHVSGPYQATPQGQARMLWKIHAICRAHGASKIFWLSFADLGRDPHYHWDNFGLLDYDRIPKPALLAHAALAKHLANAAFVREVPVEEGVRAFEFDRDGEPITMLWSDERQSIRPTLSAPVLIRDIMGNARGEFGVGSKTPLVIGPDPILLFGGRLQSD
ncbi:MAG: sulfatase-like hydrolase/transferase [Planctomycetota bacterium]